MNTIYFNEENNDTRYKLDKSDVCYYQLEVDIKDVKQVVDIFESNISSEKNKHINFTYDKELQNILLKESAVWLKKYNLRNSDETNGTIDHIQITMTKYNRNGIRSPFADHYDSDNGKCNTVLYYFSDNTIKGGELVIIDDKTNKHTLISTIPAPDHVKIVVMTGAVHHMIRPTFGHGTRKCVVVQHYIKHNDYFMD